jgi:hypothetical protein
VASKTAGETKDLNDLSSYTDVVQGVIASNKNRTNDDIKKDSKKVNDIVNKLTDLLPANGTLNKANKTEVLSVLVKVTQDKTLVTKDSLDKVSTLLSRISDGNSEDLDSDTNKQALFSTSNALNSLKNIAKNISDSERLELSNRIQKTAKKLADSQSRLEASNLSPGETKEIIADNIKITLSNLVLNNETVLLKAGNSSVELPGSLTLLFDSNERVFSQIVEWTTNPYEFLTNSSVLSNIFSLEYKSGENLTKKALSNLSEPIVFTLRVNDKDNNTFKCVYWNDTNNNGSWSTSGVELVKVEAGLVYCKTYHTTDFAINLEGDTAPLVPQNSSTTIGGEANKFGIKVIKN